MIYTDDEWETYKRLDHIFLVEDIKNVAEQLGYELTDKEISAVEDYYADNESMEYAKWDTIYNGIEQIVRERQ